MPRVALRGSMWLELGPRNGPHRAFKVFDGVTNGFATIMNWLGMFWFT